MVSMNFNNHNENYKFKFQGKGEYLPAYLCFSEQNRDWWDYPVIGTGYKFKEILFVRDLMSLGFLNSVPLSIDVLGCGNVPTQLNMRLHQVAIFFFFFCSEKVLLRL